MTNPRAPISAVLAILATALIAAGCGDDDSSSDSAATVSASELEAKATKSLTQQVGQAPESIDCPSDLEAKAGESETCTLTAEDGTQYDMTATIKSVSGDTAQFDFQVANKPK